MKSTFLELLVNQKVSTFLFLGLETPSDSMTRKWLCQRLLSNPQHSRLGTAHPRIRGHHILWRDRGSPESTRNFHRPRIQAHRTSGCRRADSSARTTRDWHIGPCPRSSFLRAKYTKTVWHFHISCAARNREVPSFDIGQT
jgi:hypothetical protein